MAAAPAVAVNSPFVSRSWGALTAFGRQMLGDRLFLLLGTGMALGVMAPAGKLATGAGIDPFLWIALFLLVSGLLLFWLERDAEWQRPGLGWFGLVAGLLANVIPASLLLLAIPHIGSGLGGLMFALSPVLTALLSTVLQVRPPSRALLASVTLGCAGALLIVLGRDGLAPSARSTGSFAPALADLTVPASPAWLLAALLIPCSLAAGNVFRTACWPAGVSPQQAGAAANLSSVPLLLLLSFCSGRADLVPLITHWPVVATQWGASCVMYLLIFRLQLIGGPTYLSQIGYVSAAVALLAGTHALHETYPPLVWAGALLILGGLAPNLLTHAKR